jgi:hypothetical protein
MAELLDIRNIEYKFERFERKPFRAEVHPHNELEANAVERIFEMLRQVSVLEQGGHEQRARPDDARVGASLEELADQSEAARSDEDSGIKNRLRA